MDASIVAKYLTKLKADRGLTYEAIAEISKVPESTVKNIILGKTERPGIDIVADIIYSLGGSLDEMYTGKSKDDVKEISINSIKEIYEQQLVDISKTHEAHVNNIRSHYEQHIEDLKENHAREVTLKDEIIKAKDSNGNFFKIFACVGLSILVALLIIEVMHPDLGWIRY